MLTLRPLMITPCNSCTFHIIEKNAVYTDVNQLLDCTRETFVDFCCLQYEADSFVLIHSYTSNN